MADAVLAESLEDRERVFHRNECSAQKQHYATRRWPSRTVLTIAFAIRAICNPNMKESLTHMFRAFSSKHQSPQETHRSPQAFKSPSVRNKVALLISQVFDKGPSVPKP